MIYSKYLFDHSNQSQNNLYCSCFWWHVYLSNKKIFKNTSKTMPGFLFL
jgi:hypothetical protein